MQFNSTISRIISYYGLTVNVLVKKGALLELLSSFIHHLYKPPYRLFMPFRLRLHRKPLILLCGASVSAWCDAPLALCEPPRSSLRSLAHSASLCLWQRRAKRHLEKGDARKEHITRSIVFAVSASRGDIGLNLYRSGTVSTILAPSSIPLFQAIR